MAGKFGSSKKKTEEEQKKEQKNKIMTRFMAEPVVPASGRAPLCALFVGHAGTGKSAVANSFVSTLKDNEVILYLDIDKGNMENVLTYHLADYTSGKINLQNIDVWTRGSGRRKNQLDYDTMMDDLRDWALVVDDCKGIMTDGKRELTIKLIVFDGISKIKQYAEWQMKNEQNVGVAGTVETRYWRVRNEDFLTMLEIFKLTPVDTIFIGNADFNQDVTNDEKYKAMYRNTDDLVSQKIEFAKEKVGKTTKFTATVKKCRQNLSLESQDRVWATVSDKEETFEPEKVRELLEAKKDVP